MANTGSLISAEHIRSIFDRFYKIDRHHTGSGIGLALVKAFVEIHGGSISVESDERLGTVFTVDLPVRTCEEGTYVVTAPMEESAPDRVDSLAQLVNALGLNAASLKHPGDVTTRDFANIMDQAENTPVQKIISHQLLRTMAKARYDTAPVGHFGLALADYCHFTSPIRRYPDTMIHRIISTWLKTKPA